MAELADLAEQAPAPAEEKYVHPEADTRADRDAVRLYGQRSGQNQPAYELTAADLAWLGRLPSDPAAVSYEEAVQLASLARASSSFTNPSDARLVQSVWAPVKELHDGRAAQAALRNAQEPLPATPAGLLEALTDAVALEVPDLTADEAHSRACRLLGDAIDVRQAEQRMAEADAQDAIDAAATATAARTSTSKVA